MSIAQITDAAVKARQSLDVPRLATWRMIGASPRRSTSGRRSSRTSAPPSRPSPRAPTGPPAARAAPALTVPAAAWPSPRTAPANTPPPGGPAGPPPPAGDPADPPTPTREEVIRDPQALLDVLGTTRDNERRLNRRLKDYERAERERTEAAKTELERATERATTAESALHGEQLGRLRLEVALEQLAGDNPAVKMAIAMAPRLQGSTREELVADAGQMRPLLGQQPAGSNGTPPPAGGFDFGSGSRLPGAAAPAAGSDAAFNAALRRAAGR